MITHFFHTSAKNPDSIEKITLDTASTVPSLTGTQFTIKYYAGQYATATELSATTRTWIIEVHESVINGETVYNTRLNAEYKVGGDDFCYGDNGVLAALIRLIIYCSE